MSPGFSVVAIIAAFNEADIIEHVVSDLIDQGVQVYFLDDGSTDDTASIVQRHVGNGVLAVEQLAEASDGAPPARFEWERILLRKTQLAAELAASWFIHHDADEFRESPWSQLSLVDAIRRVDAFGFNAIDFQGLDFWPVDDRFRSGDDVREALTLFRQPAHHDRVQIRAWKKTGSVDLISSGGHEARFPNRRVFPLRFILRHYPVRGQAHGERKIFRERRDRFLERERARGWHVQYDAIPEGASLIRDGSTMTPYDPEAVRINLMLRHRGVEALEESIEEQRRELDRTRERLTSELEDVRASLDAQAIVLAQTRTELTAGHAELVQTHEELMARSQELDQRNHELAQRSRDLDERNRQLADRSRDLDERNHQLADRSRDLDLRNRELADRNRDLDQRNHQLAAVRAEAAGLTQVLELRDAEIVACHRSLDDSARRLREFEQSFSWRWMAPARAVLRVLRGR